MVASRSPHRPVGSAKARTARTGNHRVQPIKGSFYEPAFMRQMAPHMIMSTSAAKSIVSPPTPPVNEPTLQHALLPTGSSCPSRLFISQGAALLEDLKGRKTWQTDAMLPAINSCNIEGGVETEIEEPRFFTIEKQRAGGGLFTKHEYKAGYVIASEMPRLLVDSALLLGPAAAKDSSLQDVIRHVGQLLDNENQIFTDLLEAEAGEGKLFSQLLPITIRGGQFLVLLSTMSKINHSCRPNAK